MYWNFQSKEDLFFALMDERVDRLLLQEYWALAVRDEELRARYVERRRALCGHLADALEARHRTTGVPLTVPAEAGG